MASITGSGRSPTGTGGHDSGHRAGLQRQPESHFVSYYAQVDWDSQMFGKRFRGNVGLRGYQTDTDSKGWIQGDSYAYLGTADVKGHYSGVLPALNTVLELNDDLLRASPPPQNLNCPTLGSLAAEVQAFRQRSAISMRKATDCDRSKRPAAIPTSSLSPTPRWTCRWSTISARSACCQRACSRNI